MGNFSCSWHVQLGDHSKKIYLFNLISTVVPMCVLIVVRVDRRNHSLGWAPPTNSHSYTCSIVTTPDAFSGKSFNIDTCCIAPPTHDEEPIPLNPFEELNMAMADRVSLKRLANQNIMINLDLCIKYMSNSKHKVDSTHWKLLKEKEKLKVYSERSRSVAAAIAAADEPTSSGLPMILCVGTMEGKLDDLMYGVISEDLETTRMKASYVDNFSGAAVLNSVVLPTVEDPFQSLVVKWMELDIPLHSTNLVKNLTTSTLRSQDMSRTRMVNVLLITCCTR